MIIGSNEPERLGSPLLPFRARTLMLVMMSDVFLSGYDT